MNAIKKDGTAAAPTTGKGNNKPRTIKPKADDKKKAIATGEEVKPQTGEADGSAAAPNPNDDNKGQEVKPPVLTGEESDSDFDKGQRDGLLPEGEGAGEGTGGQVALTDDGGLEVDEQKKLLQQGRDVVIIPWERLTKIEKSQSNVSLKSLYKEWKKDQAIIADRERAVEEAEKKGEPVPEWKNETTMRFDEAIQRNYVWTEQQKSDLIHSILYGFYVPPVLVKDTNDGKKWFLDGNQRINTLMRYIDGQFKLSNKTADVYGHKIAGLKFKDLQEGMQETIFDETITIVRLKHMTVEERDLMFVKLNSGSSLKGIELTRAKHSELIEGVNALSEHKFFKDDIELSKQARVRFIDQEIILQITMLMEEGVEKIKGFGSKQVDEYVLRLKEAGKTLSGEMIQRFEKVADYLNIAFEDYELDEIKRALKKVHVPMIFWTAEFAVKENLQPKLFGDFIRSFLIKSYSVESKYGKACQGKTSTKESVLVRIKEMTSSFDEFMKMIQGADSIEEGIVQFEKKLADENGVTRQLDVDDVEESE